MRTVPHRRWIAGAPPRLPALPALPLVVVAALSVAAALTLTVAGYLTHQDVAGKLAATARPLFLSSRAWISVSAVARVVMFATTAVAMRWRTRTGGPEAAVWCWLARAAVVAAGASTLAVGLDVAARHGMQVATGAGNLAGTEVVGGAGTTGGVGVAVLNLGILAACPLLYQGLIRWNRYGTLTSEPGDWLNGLGAVFALAAVGNLTLHWSHSALLQWPGWQLQLWIIRVAAELMLVGTAATVLIIGGLLRDARAWALTLTITLTAGLDATAIGDPAAAAGDGAYSDLGYGSLAVVLAFSALARPGAPLPRPTTSEAPTAGSFIVLLASLTVLAGTGLLIPGPLASTRTASIWWATLWAIVGAAAVAWRGLHSIRLLAHLLISRHEALTDELTGLANRRALDRRLIEDCTADRPFTLMIIDLDGFKQVNDRFGHAVGDELLHRAGALLQTVATAPALAARLGGDEFAIVLPGHSVQAAEAVFAALARATAAPVLIDGRRLLVHGSVGIATSAPGDKPEQVLRHADAAMYRAKTAGGARCAIHDEAAAKDHAQQAQLVEELKALLGTRDARDDVESGDLAVYYQPQLSRTGHVVGAEALVRWDNPRLGLLTPDIFLDHVEQYGLMHALTTEVLSQAVHQVANWQHAGLFPQPPTQPSTELVASSSSQEDARPRLRISVNLSATSLTHPDLPALVDRLLAESGLAPTALVLEITETSIMVEPEESIARLQDLAARGIGISIDDYGSGYSSLAYLNDLPASELKLDRSLTKQVTTNARTASIVAGTVSLAHGLGLRVIAEGVEDTTMLDVLHALGCDETQGFLHARPLNADAFITWWITTAATTATAETTPSTQRTALPEDTAPADASTHPSGQGARSPITA